MASGDNSKHLKGHSGKDVGSVSGNTMHHSAARAANAYQSKETPGWQKIEVPPKGSYKERDNRPGTDVGVPGELNLP